MLWIPVTIFAAFSQNLRFMLQKHLKSTGLTTTGATFARFLYSAPVIAVILLIYMRARGVALPEISDEFWRFAIAGGIAQILATMLVVALFSERNFTVGIALKKTEVMLTALLGFVVLGEGPSALGLAAIGVGFLGVLLLSDPPKTGGTVTLTGRIFNKASVYGLGSGLLFGVSAIGYRGATLSVAADDVFLRAGLTLSLVTLFQTIVMSIWLLMVNRAEIGRVLASWRVSGLVGLTSMMGSLGWFVAFALQSAAYVKALGQIELVFTFLTSYFIFREKSTWREVLGTLIIVASILLLILAI